MGHRDARRAVGIPSAPWAGPLSSHPGGSQGALSQGRFPPVLKGFAPRGGMGTLLLPSSRDCQPLQLP